MTIDQRVEAYLAESADYQMAAEGIKHMARQSLKSLLLEVARDQRQHSSLAVGLIEPDDHNKLDVNLVVRTILSATLEAK